MDDKRKEGKEGRRRERKEGRDGVVWGGSQEGMTDSQCARDIFWLAK